MGVQLSQEELWEFLENGHTGILTSLRRDGQPISLPIWYAVVDRMIYVRGPAHTKKFRRIRNDPRVSFLVETGLKWAELKAVHLSGKARLVEDPDELKRADEALAKKYVSFRTPTKKMPAASKRHYGRGSSYIRIEPEEWITWDNAKLRLGG